MKMELRSSYSPSIDVVASLMGLDPPEENSKYLALIIVLLQE